MTEVWRKVEAALDAYFKADGWSLDTRGDHLATKQSFSIDEDVDDGDEIIVNTTECAKHIAAEVAQC